MVKDVFYKGLEKKTFKNNEKFTQNFLNRRFIIDDGNVHGKEWTSFL